MIHRRKPPPGNVRRVTYISRNIRGVTTNKRGRLVQFESEQERKLILLLERDRTVVDYASQPEILSFRDEKGHPRQYTPDFQVWRMNGAIELHEVVPRQAPVGGCFEVVGHAARARQQVRHVVRILQPHPTHRPE